MGDLLRALARITLVDRPVGAVLTEILQVARVGSLAQESVSVTLLRGEKAFTAAYSGEMAIRAEEMQYECPDTAPSARAVRDEQVKAVIARVFEANLGVYGPARSSASCIGKVIGCRAARSSDGCASPASPELCAEGLVQDVSAEVAARPGDLVDRNREGTSRRFRTERSPSSLPQASCTRRADAEVRLLTVADPRSGPEEVHGDALGAR